MRLYEAIDLFSSGTSEGAEKGWDARGRGRKQRTDRFLDDYHAGTKPFSHNVGFTPATPDAEREKKIRVWGEKVGMRVGVPQDFAEDGWQSHPDRIVLNEIEVPRTERKRGLGTQGLIWLTNLADKHRVSLALQARPFSNKFGMAKGPDKAQLISWYKKHGFLEVDDNGVMTREPQER